MFSLSYNVFLNHNTLFLLATLSTQFLISCSLIRFVWSRVNSTKISSDIHEALIDPEGRHGSKQNVENSITKAPLIGIIISVVLLQLPSGFLNLLSSLV